MAMAPAPVERVIVVGVATDCVTVRLPGGESIVSLALGAREKEGCKGDKQHSRRVGYRGRSTLEVGNAEGLISVFLQTGSDENERIISTA